MLEIANRFLLRRNDMEQMVNRFLLRRNDVDQMVNRFLLRRNDMDEMVNRFLLRRNDVEQMQTDSSFVGMTMIARIKKRRGMQAHGNHAMRQLPRR